MFTRKIGLVLMMLALSATSAHAEGTATAAFMRAVKVQTLVSDFLLAREAARQTPRSAVIAAAPGAGTFDFRDRRDECDDDDLSCVDVVCDRLGTFGCDSQSEVSAVLSACRGNDDGGCISSLCDRLGTFGCDSLSEVQAVAASCANNRGGECVTSVCNHLGTFGCDSQAEVTRVAEACRGNRNADCVDAVCERLGTFGCDSESEVLQVVRECAGNR